MHFFLFVSLFALNIYQCSLYLVLFEKKIEWNTEFILVIQKTGYKNGNFFLLYLFS